MVAVFFMGGIVLTVQGIMGIYIGKIFSELKGRPLYVVGETIGFGRMAGSRKAARSNIDIMQAVEKTGHRKPAAQIETPGRLVAAFGHPLYAQGDPRAALLLSASEALGQDNPALKRLRALSTVAF